MAVLIFSFVIVLLKINQFEDFMNPVEINGDLDNGTLNIIQILMTLVLLLIALFYTFRVYMLLKRKGTSKDLK